MELVPSGVVEVTHLQLAISPLRPGRVLRELVVRRPRSGAKASLILRGGR